MTLKDLCFSYGEKVILNRFSLDLPDTGVTALAGPSGCGKTTLLRLIAGLERPQGGTLDVPDSRETAFLFQENRLLPGLTAAKQVAAVLPKGGSPLPWLEAVGLAGEENALPQNLSGGMQRRLALARCLAYGGGKALLLLDEPFTGVDPERAFQIMNFVRSLGPAVLFTAHDAQSLALADHTIRLDGPPLRQIDGGTAERGTDSLLN